ncbi:Fic/DOC family protein [Curtobacterium sp. L1-20]|uniref:Fic/DOC family protein n=1 Tax=Curtobacterium sp. L1-20 TaxID=3138181 RepID=UPI003B52BF3B
MPTPVRAWDDYFIPGTTVLRNKLGATTAADLAAREEFAASLRLAELVEDPVRGGFDYDHMKEIHRRIFQDVYEWAGQERVGPDTRMTKDGPDVVNYAVGDPAAPTVAYGYYPGPGVASAAEHQYRLLEREHHLAGLPRERFVERLAEHWGELNTIHAFREGNTRAQFVFFSDLTNNAGYRLDAGRFHVGAPLRDAFVAARFYNQATGRSDRLAEVLDQAITARDDRPRRSGGGSSIERLQQRVDEQRARAREQFQPGGFIADSTRRGPQHGPRQ